MNIQDNVQSVSDDQELAKVLAGVGQEADNLQFEETAGPAMPAPTTLAPADDTAANPEPAVIEPLTAAPVEPTVATAATDATTAATGAPTIDPALDSIKQTALNELRPLVGKLNVSAEEKFDTYLLLLRSTDDKSLIAPAYEAAASITDEARKAQALLDIIKEIDFLSQK